MSHPGHTVLGMNSTPASAPIPLVDGTVPVPSQVGGVDWSGDPAAAMVGRLVEAVGQADRWAARVIDELIRVVESSATEATLGVAVELVLSQTCRAVGFERRTLLRAATTLAAMPATRQAFREGWISWSQVRAVVTAVGCLDRDGRDRVDDLVAELAPTYVDLEADALVVEVDWLVDQLRAELDVDRHQQPVTDTRLVLQPALDGSGRYWGEADRDHFPLFAQSVENRAADRFPLDAVPDVDDTMAVGDRTADAAVTAAHRHAARIGRRNAVRRGLALFELVTGCDATTLAPLDHHDSAGSGRPSVLVTCDLDTLLGDTTPGWVLSGLAGRMKATGTTIRRWVDTHGADGRLIVFDDVGQVVGVGRRNRFAPGWLRDAIIARDLHDTAPCSTTPAVHCHVDHVTGWADGGAPTWTTSPCCRPGGTRPNAAATGT